MSFCLLHVISTSRLLPERVGSAYSWGRDVRKVGGNTGSVDDIVEGELIDERAGLEEERKRLARRVSISVSSGIRGDRGLESYLTNAARGTSNNCANDKLASGNHKTPKAFSPALQSSVWAKMPKQGRCGVYSRWTYQL